MGFFFGPPNNFVSRVEKKGLERKGGWVVFVVALNSPNENSRGIIYFWFFWFWRCLPFFSNTHIKIKREYQVVMNNE